jgi:hypothetical protein
MKRKKNVLFAITLLFAGVCLMVFGSKSMAIYYSNRQCDSVSATCGTYTSCAQFYGNCGPQSSNDGKAYIAIINDPQMGGFCYLVPNATGCNFVSYACNQQYFTDTACQKLACTDDSNVQNICTIPKP